MSYLESKGNEVVREVVRAHKNQGTGYPTEFPVGEQEHYIRLVRQTLNSLGQDREYTPVTTLLARSQAEAEYKARQMAIANPGYLMERLKQAYELGDSWRNFKVGAVAYASFFNKFDEMWRIGIYTGANAKPAEHTTINVHAEHTNMTKATELRGLGELVSIPFLAVMGDIQPDQQTGLASSTLHPCGVCRDAFADSLTPVGDETMFMSANRDMTQFEWYTLAALNKFHDHQDTSDIGSALFTDTPLSFAFDVEQYQSLYEMAQLLNRPDIEQSDMEIAVKLAAPMLRYADAHYESL